MSATPLDQFVRALEASERLNQRLLEEITELRDVMQDVSPRLASVDWLVREVRDGNGHDSLMTRMRLVETSLVGLTRDQEGFEATIQDAGREELALKDANIAETRKREWQLKLALLGGAAGLLTALVELFLRMR